LPSQALTSWRKFSTSRPALVVLADQPYLENIPESLQRMAHDLIETGSDAELVRQSDYDQPDPLVLAPQAVRAALLAKLFREVVWLLPDDRPLAEFSWSVMEAQLRESGLLADGQNLELSADGGVGRTMVEGVPLTIAHPDAWSMLKMTSPALLHVDLSYFRSAYRSEARIPVYELITTVAGMLRSMNLSVLAVTLSYSTVDGYVDLGGRFTIPTLAQLLRDPKILEAGMPRTWQLRAQALNKRLMFSETEATALYHELLTLTPDDPAALYDVASRMFFAKQFAGGLELLDRAVSLDSGYAVKYLHLAEQARQAGDLENAVLLLTKYRRIAPDHPGIKLRLAELLKAQGDDIEAQALLRELEQLPWSQIYHAQIPELLKAMGSEQ